jgi:hypothetical protein
MKKVVGFLFVIALAGCGGRISTVDDGSQGTNPSPTTTPAPTGNRPPPPTVGGGGGTVPTDPTEPTKPPPPTTGKVVYTAYAWPGGLDHLEIAKADFSQNRCTRVFLTNPGSSSELADIYAPSQWGVQSAQRSPLVEGCVAGKPGKPVSFAYDGSGKIYFKEDPGTYLPCTVSIHTGLLFKDAPEKEALDADGVKVEGGCQ